MKLQTEFSHFRQEKQELEMRYQQLLEERQSSPPIGIADSSDREELLNQIAELKDSQSRLLNEKKNLEEMLEAQTVSKNIIYNIFI